MCFVGEVGDEGVVDDRSKWWGSRNSPTSRGGGRHLLLLFRLPLVLLKMMMMLPLPLLMLLLLLLLLLWLLMMVLLLLPSPLHFLKIQCWGRWGSVFLLLLGQRVEVVGRSWN